MVVRPVARAAPQERGQAGILGPAEGMPAAVESPVAGTRVEAEPPEAPRGTPGAVESAKRAQVAQGPPRAQVALRVPRA